MTEDEKTLVKDYALGLLEGDELERARNIVFSNVEASELWMDTTDAANLLGWEKPSPELFESINEAIQKEELKEKVRKFSVSALAVLLIGFISIGQLNKPTTFYSDSELAVKVDGTNGFISIDPEQELSDEEVFQLWGLSGDKVISLGVLGQEPQDVGFSTEGISAIMVTVENRGGVTQSSNPAVYDLELT